MPKCARCGKEFPYPSGREAILCNTCFKPHIVYRRYSSEKAVAHTERRRNQVPKRIH